ncbi:hypothetical protein APHAL10511_002423 [Amanita phalloides]|nr:hypothetical protein APHAL10511_002423 [Amanita phalloides]
MVSGPPTQEPRQNNANHFTQWMFGFGAGGLTLFYSRRIYLRLIKRIPNADHVTPTLFAEKRWIKGVVTSVGDADGFRFFHTPRLSGLSWPFKFRRVPTKNLKDRTISIRIAGVDAPEGAHFGNDAQPFATESKAWLKNRILRKTVMCQLLQRDQYSRIVANVSLPGIFLSKNLALEMLRTGWATTYEQASAQYGKEGKDAYIAAEKQAKAKRRGMWKRGTNIETPSEYKRKHRQSTTVKTPSKL